MNSKAKILLVDDDHIFRLGCKRLLENDGFSVIEAQDGTEGFIKAKNHRPDIAFIDYRMPGLDGLDLLQQLKSEALDIDVVMITG